MYDICYEYRVTRLLFRPSCSQGLEERRWPSPTLAVLAMPIKTHRQSTKGKTTCSRVSKPCSTISSTERATCTGACAPKTHTLVLIPTTQHDEAYETPSTASDLGGRQPLSPLLRISRRSKANASIKRRKGRDDITANPRRFGPLLPVVQAPHLRPLLRMLPPHLLLHPTGI
jgi:hypothetical protein